jgi:hypothetical protein
MFDDEAGQIEAHQLSESFGPILNSGSNRFMGSNDTTARNSNWRDQRYLQFCVLQIQLE